MEDVIHLGKLTIIIIDYTILPFIPIKEMWMIYHIIKKKSS